MPMRLPALAPLHWAFAASVAVHAGLLGYRFIDPEGFDRVFRDRELEVILVNAKSNETPVRPQAIAQASLAGGGEAAAGRATSPLPPAAEVVLGDAAEDARRKVDELVERQHQLLAQVRREIALLPAPDPTSSDGSPAEREREERRRQLLDRLAEIEKRINEDSAQPRRRYVGPSTREEAYAVYYDRLRRRIEDRGTRDFPEHGGRKLYGELTMNFTVDAQGRLLEAEVVRSSDSRILDRRAVAIVRAAAPFGRFSPAMRAQADQIVVTARFRFTREEGLETSLSAH